MEVMERASSLERLEVLRGEGLKAAMEISLAGLSKSTLGMRLIETYAHGLSGRLVDTALSTTMADLEFENPITVGAGWDKKGRAVAGLYALGFSGVEVGTVPLFGQPGNPKPRLWTINKGHSVGLNRLGFNSNGSEAVDREMESRRPFPCHVGINIGKNKMMPDDLSPWAHAEALKQLYNHASYVVFNPSSPNTAGLTELQKREPLRAHIEAMKEAMEQSGGQKPLMVKLSPDMQMDDFDDAIAVAVEAGVAGLVLVNTTASQVIKQKYGKHEEAGGLSGNEWEYRALAVYMVQRAYEQAGDKLEIIGVGAISDTHDAIERIMAGASLLQVVTGIREHNGRVAPMINRGILNWMQRRGVSNVKELIGHGTKRGPKYPKAA